MYKLLILLTALLLLNSCDTGFSGEVDPNREVFNYEYPLTKGNKWVYIVKEQKTNFSNPLALAEIGADTVTYSQITQICSNEALLLPSVNKILRQIDSYNTQKANSLSLIDTLNLKSITSFYRDNKDGYYYEYGTKDSVLHYIDGKQVGHSVWNVSYNSPFKLLKYNTYPGDQWEQSNLISKITCKISGFLNLDKERLCLISKREFEPESPAEGTPADTIFHEEYYSYRGLIKAVSTDYKKSMKTINGQETTFDLIITKELIKSNLK